MNNTGIVMLSILVPSIPERKAMLRPLLKDLKRQRKSLYRHKMLGRIEVVCDNSASFLNGGLSIGKKREALLNRATGRYVCFLDDDDNISPNYLESMLRMCNHGLDVCTFRAFVKLENLWGLVDMRLAYRLNDQFTPEHTIRRTPWHTCAVRRDFAILYPFDDISNAEDYHWMSQVLKHCTTEYHTDMILLQYNHGKHSEADKIENHE